jgi:hypothetical protein
VNKHLPRYLELLEPGLIIILYLVATFDLGSVLIWSQNMRGILRPCKEEMISCKQQQQKNKKKLFQGTRQQTGGEEKHGLVSSLEKLLLSVQV